MEIPTEKNVSASQRLPARSKQTAKIFYLSSQFASGCGQKGRGGASSGGGEGGEEPATQEREDVDIQKLVIRVKPAWQENKGGREGMGINMTYIPLPIIIVSSQQIQAL